ncbi:MAG TPA: hypothetical protein VM513_22920 [Kofleriaceae bacterium]|jgi:hypothetical protein|nr:hypothetical protein [Kofleriaceae bacterium]
MGGCTNCKGKAGCDDHKGSMMAEVERALADLYRTQTWGEVDDTSPQPTAPDELAALAEELATELKAATFVRAGGDDEPCDYIYILALGRTPCAIQVRDHGVDAPAEWSTLDAIDEQYLRVVVSQRVRVAAVQQVAVQVVRTPDGFVIHERPRAGVYDAPLLSRMQRLVTILPAYDLTHLDFGDIAHAPPGFHAGPWQDLYGAAPSIANYLFYPQPQTMVSTTFVPATGAVA